MSARWLCSRHMALKQEKGLDDTGCGCDPARVFGSWYGLQDDESWYNSVSVRLHTLNEHSEFL